MFQVLNVKSQELIVDLTNHINKVDLDEDIKNYFEQKNSEFREPAVGVNLHHRDTGDGRGQDNYRDALVSRTLSFCCLCLHT